MRVFVGIIFGAILTVASAYCYDALTGKAVTSASTTSATADERPLVNWDVVDSNWRTFETNLRAAAARVHDQWTKRSG